MSAGALSRVLAEDYRRSTDLAYNVVRIFLSFSNFVEMHQLLAQYRVGSVCVEVVDFEVKRAEHRAAEATRRTAALADARTAAARGEAHRDDVAALEKAHDKEASRARKVRRRQDKTLYVCLHVLLNLAEDSSVEHKIAKRHLVARLTSVVAHATSAPLLILASVFLAKLAVVAENKDAMGRIGLAGQMARFLPCGSPELVVAMLRVAHNLSFDEKIRDQMVKHARGSGARSVDVLLSRETARGL